MNSIRLNRLIPHFLVDEREIVSDIWNKEICFEKECYYEIVANSGTGKSSLLSYIFGERKDYSGDIFFENTHLLSVTEKEWSRVRGDKLALVFQDLRLFPELNAIENIELKNQLTKYKSVEEIEELLIRVGLKDKMALPAAKLSFGQQQRVAILRAFCQDFDFILMDEPFSHLDDSNITILCKLLISELEKRKAGLIITTLGAKYPIRYNSSFLL